jgi:hypothetical protein
MKPQQVPENGNSIANQIYDLYNKTISPKRKSSVRSKKNIDHHLKHHTPENLKQAIYNYDTVKPDGPEYRKDKQRRSIQYLCRPCANAKAGP